MIWSTILKVSKPKPPKNYLKFAVIFNYLYLIKITPLTKMKLKHYTQTHRNNIKYEISDTRLRKHVHHRQDIDRRYRANKSFASLELCTLEFFYKWRHFCREILEMSECTHIQTRQIFVYRHLGALWRFDVTFLQSIKTIRIHNFLARDTLFLK